MFKATFATTSAVTKVQKQKLGTLRLHLSWSEGTAYPSSVPNLLLKSQVLSGMQLTACLCLLVGPRDFVDHQYLVLTSRNYVALETAERAFGKTQFQREFFSTNLEFTGNLQHRTIPNSVDGAANRLRSQLLRHSPTRITAVDRFQTASIETP